jgi:DNA mismatch endonuclease (patch repair protein)
MARVRSKNTSPEIYVRSSLHKAGLRFRIHRKDLPGTPDIVFPSRRLAIFINGCFWHVHEGCRRARMPSSRPEYWEQKLRKNAERDVGNYAALQASGWNVLVIWECEITQEKMFDLVTHIRAAAASPRTLIRHY